MHRNVAILGLGGMGAYHWKKIPTDAGFTVTAAADINPERLKPAKEAGLQVYDTAEALFADPDIDLIVVATPNNFHREYVIGALRAGKHVVCEKPVALNAAELTEMTQAARETGRIFTIHQNRRWDKDYRIVREAIAQGLIGQPFSIESRVQGANGIPGDWRCVKEAGGGMLLDWGVHLLDQMLDLIDSPVTEVYAQLLSRKFPGVDDNCKVLLRFENGVTALVEVSTYCFLPLPRWQALGDGGTLQIADWSCKGSVVRANRIAMHWEPGIVYTASGPTKTMAPRPEESLETLPLPEVHTDWTEYYRNLAAALDGKAQLIVTPEQALRVMRVIDACFESSKKGVAIHGLF